MEIFNFIVITFYLLSTLGYFAYLFLQKDVYQQTGFYLLVAGFCCHTAAIGFRFIQSGHFPVNNLHEVLSIAGWTVAGVFLVFQYRLHLKILGVYAAPLVSLVMIIAAKFPN
ncbi:MAG: c-type cytochrome biogenesis protein CcsB, partial [Desulfobacteraceae bacterium]|nr:c-type cytochrome biogenesis protein CcsB [Desulfobacteraceae bacterium]